MKRQDPHMTSAEFARKLERLRRVLAHRNKDAVILDTAKNVVWLTGMRSYVNIATDAALARLVVLPDRVVALTGNNERERLEEEECPGLPITWQAYPWFEDGSRETITAQVTAGFSIASEDALEADLVQLRTELLEPEMERARLYGPEIGRIMYDVALSLEDGMTENDLAGQLSGSLMGAGMQPLVVLVAADHRCGFRPHPLPTSLPIHHRALMAVSVLTPGGLVLSVTRQAVLQEPTDTEVAQHRALQHIFTAIASTATAGQTSSELWQAVVEAYSDYGFPGGFNHHHQGGLAGYQSRETFLRPDSTWVVPETALTAFNPTGGATKAEDTVLVVRNTLTPVTLYEGEPTEAITAGGVTWQRPTLIVVG
ncbi:MAG: M24 family metallopeptidase [Clostridia bacterium]